VVERRAPENELERLAPLAAAGHILEEGLLFRIEVAVPVAPHRRGGRLQRVREEPFGFLAGGVNAGGAEPGAEALERLGAGHGGFGPYAGAPDAARRSACSALKSPSISSSMSPSRTSPKR
jgi:hypothetical protein